MSSGIMKERNWTYRGALSSVKKVLVLKSYSEKNNGKMIFHKYLLTRFVMESTKENT